MEAIKSESDHLTVYVHAGEVAVIMTSEEYEAFIHNLPPDTIGEDSVK